MNCCFESGQVLVLPRTGLDDMLGSLDDFGVGVRDVLYSVEDILRHYGIGAGRAGEAKQARPMKLPPLLPALIRVRPGDEHAMAERMRAQGSVLVAIPNYYVRPLLVPLERNAETFDAFIRESGLVAMSSRCGENVRIAILDTGVDASALAGSPFMEQFDTDAPRDVTSGLGPYDPNGHGTLVATIILGGAPGARIRPIKVMTENGNLMSVVTGLYAAMAADTPDIFNLSLGLTCDLGQCVICGAPVTAPVSLEQLKLLFGQIDEIYRSNGEPEPLLVAAAGNADQDSPLALPAAFPNALAVGAVRSPSDPSIASYSRYSGVPVERFIRAPGGEDTDTQCLALQLQGGGSTLGDHPRWHVRRLFGTSFATAIVSAIAARYLCAARGGACSGFAAKPVRTREFLLDALGRGARRDGTAADRSQYGLGIARYDRPG
jgi:subtilisin family serine protease